LRRIGTQLSRRFELRGRPSEGFGNPSGGSTGIHFQSIKGGSKAENGGHFGSSGCLIRLHKLKTTELSPVKAESRFELNICVEKEKEASVSGLEFDAFNKQ
jgi:hypothetical protein